jgi:hypothetical protein
VSALVIVPVTIKSAKAFVLKHHRHLKVVGWGRFAAGVAVDGRLCGVGIVGNGPRVWEGTSKAVITRVATDGTSNACSAIYGALCRAARALGYSEVWTYTLAEEPGTSLRAAGFVDQGLTDGGEHDRPQSGRRRKPALRPEPKRRWLRRLT